MHKVDVAVVGQGIIGRSIAFRLMEEPSTTIATFNRDDSAAGSPAAQAVSSMKGATVARHSLFGAKMCGFVNFPKWVDQIRERSGEQGLRVFFGAIEPFRDEAEYQELVERAAHGEPFGVRRMAVVNAKELSQLRFILKDGTAALYFPDEAHAQPQKIMDGLALAVNGRAIVAGELTGCTKIKDGWILYANDFELISRHVVLAPGRKTNEVLRMFGLPELRLYESPGVTNWLRRPPSLPDGTLILRRKSAWSACGDEVSYNTADTTEINAVAKILGADTTEVKSRYGVRVRTQSRFPLVAPVSMFQNSNLVLATGFYKSGFQLADIAAQSVCNYLRANLADSFMQESIRQNAKYSPVATSKPKLDLV
jgi:glycine/D-amino acid oxidase-like deaminating enzyme